MITTATTTAAPHDKHGFPLKSCTRCGGGGHFGPMSVEGGRCFKCGGSGWVHASKKVSEAYTAYREALIKALRPQIKNLAAGDEVTSDVTYSNRVAADATWRTVEAVSVTPRRCGSMLEGLDEANRIHFYDYVITFTDGTFRVTSENSIWARRGLTVDPAPYVAQATTRARRA